MQTSLFFDMSAILERLRANHELYESIELAIGDELDITKPAGQKARVRKQHAIHTHVQNGVRVNKELSILYEDKDGLLKEEVKKLKEGDVFESFYHSLGKTLEYHKRYPDLVVEDISPGTLSSKVNEGIDVNFSGEEVFGKYLDLNEQHTLYSSLSFVDDSVKEDYSTFLDKFLDFDAVNERLKEKEKKGYGAYLQSLLEYFLGFLSRVQPLVNTARMTSEWESEFDDNWSKGGISGWTVAMEVSEAANIDLDSYKSAKDIETLGGNRLKVALEQKGLKGGGTVQERAQRLWSVKGMAFEDIPKKLKAKGAAAGAEDRGIAATKGGGKKELAWREYQVTRLSELLLDVIKVTRDHVETQQSRSADEKHRELLEEEGGMPSVLEGDDSDGDSEDGPVHNPLKLPLGWDGKPIPFWMYRLYGLNEEFNCEICGNEIYKGRKNFDRHFIESKHTGNLRLLGIPNTKHFHGVVKIVDAMNLYAKISAEMVENRRREETEEFEDSSGQVLDRHTFEARARTGQL